MSQFWNRMFSGKQLALNALAIFAVGALAAGVAPARSHERGCGHGGGFDRLERKLEKLDLDATTRANVSALLERARSDQQAFREQKREAHEQLRELMQQEAPSVDAVLAQADTIGAIRTESDKLRLRTMIELRSLLGPERWAEFGAMKRKYRHERTDRGS